MVHWAQTMREPPRGALRRYSYGTSCATPFGAPRRCNQHAYGALLPPAYNLSAIAGTTLSLFSGDADILADPADVKRLAGTLPRSVLSSFLEISSYSHLDFTWGLNANTKVYGHVIELLRAAAAAAEAR